MSLHPLSLTIGAKMITRRIFPFPELVFELHAQPVTQIDSRGINFQEWKADPVQFKGRFKQGPFCL